MTAGIGCREFTVKEGKTQLEELMFWRRRVWCGSKENLKRDGSKSVQFSSVAQSCLTLCDPMNRSTPGPPVHHQLPEFTQTQVHRVGDAI